uniref:Uncharacterized protein n=1 Tax=Arcella intermedia TaxID=1963864 RepID=A0A6B2LBV3_9EUKA
MNDNGFSGSIPSSFEGLISLQYLDLSNNTFTGSLPTFENVQTLINLYAHSTGLSGPVSVPFSGCGKLGTGCDGGGRWERRNRGKDTVTRTDTASISPPFPFPNPSSPPTSISCSAGPKTGLCISNNISINITNTDIQFINITSSTVTIIGNLSTDLISLLNSTLHLEVSLIDEYGKIIITNGQIIVKSDVELKYETIVINSANSNMTVFGKAVITDSTLHFPSDHLNEEIIIMTFQNTSSITNLKVETPNSCSPILKSNQTSLSVLFQSNKCTSITPC